VTVLNRELNRVSAERSVNSLLRIFLKLASPETVIVRAASAYGRAYDRGAVTPRKLGEARFAIELRGRPGMSALAREGFGIGVEMIVKRTRASNIRVLSTAHADGADYVVTWRA
jgi:hypothetical protein